MPATDRGDPANLAFGGLYRMDIALYRRHDPSGFAARLGARRQGPAAYGVRWGAAQQWPLRLQQGNPCPVLPTFPHYVTWQGVPRHTGCKCVP